MRTRKRHLQSTPGGVWESQICLLICFYLAKMCNGRSCQLHYEAIQTVINAWTCFKSHHERSARKVFSVNDSFQNKEITIPVCQEPSWRLCEIAL